MELKEFVVIVFAIMCITLAVVVDIQKEKIRDLERYNDYLTNTDISWMNFATTGNFTIYVDGREFVDLKETNYTSFSYWMRCEKSAINLEISNMNFKGSMDKWNVVDVYPSYDDVWSLNGEII